MTLRIWASTSSRKGQADLSSFLGENVRRAVEQLIDAHQTALDTLAADLGPSHIYQAAVRMIMRVVVVLFAEARGLLPVDNTIYHAAYGLRGLQEDLHKLKRSQRLSVSQGAWPRLLALFRLVHEGCYHPDLPVHAYGGELFQPGSDAEDGMLRAIRVFENACFEDGLAVPDTFVESILTQLTRTTERIRTGTVSRTVAVPIDFSDLSSVYIGILYEGLLGYELKQVPENEVAVPLPSGQQPVLLLSQLKELSGEAFKELSDAYGKPTRAPQTEHSGELEEYPDEPEAAVPEGYDEGYPDPGRYEEEEAFALVAGPAAHSYGLEALEDVNADERYAFAFRSPDQQLTEDLHTTLVETVKRAGMVKAPKRTAPRERWNDFEQQVREKAESLSKEAHFAGKRYLVRWGGTRKGSGSFDTRPGLSIPTIQRTLAPLAYQPPQTPSGENWDAPLHEWVPRTPEEILSIKVCDPACGSGTFPVGALRFLTQALWDAVHHHQRVSATGDHRTAVSLFGEKDAGESLGDEFLPCRPDDETYEPRLRARLKRHVAERCIYGVDLDPLATELCRLALWIETLDPELPFTFLNHKIKCGNGLVGCWFDRFQDFPALALHRPGDDAGDTKTGPRSTALKTLRDARIKTALKHWIESQDPGVFSFLNSGSSVTEQHATVTRLFAQLHDFPVHEAEARARFYWEKVEPALGPLREAFDAWCALWFWPLDRLDLLPNASTFATPSVETRAVIADTAARIRFFHWELEFPDVFTALDSGFSAILGNPPWEIQKPSSKKFFSNHVPLY